MMPEDTERFQFARVLVDALAGDGKVLHKGEVVETSVLGEHLQILVFHGAVELCEVHGVTPPRIQIDLL